MALSVIDEKRWQSEYPIGRLESVERRPGIGRSRQPFGSLRWSFPWPAAEPMFGALIQSTI
jgi:hypothetical protein